MSCGCKSLPGRDPAVILGYSCAMASVAKVRNTCTALRESNAVTAGKHLLNKRSNHLVCQSYTCASTVRSVRDTCGSIGENLQRTGSDIVHCRAAEMFHQEGPLAPGITKILD